MGNVVGECCPNGNFRNHPEMEKIVWDEIREPKVYPIMTIILIQSVFRGHVQRKLVRSEDCLTFLFSKIKTSCQKEIKISE